MTKQEIVTQLEQKGLKDITDLIYDAENGDLEELELVESIGLVFEDQLNREVIQLLQELGVKITYLTDDEEDYEDEDEEGEL